MESKEQDLTKIHDLECEVKRLQVENGILNQSIYLDKTYIKESVDEFRRVTQNFKLENERLQVENESISKELKQTQEKNV